MIQSTYVTDRLPSDRRTGVAQSLRALFAATPLGIVLSALRADAAQASTTRR